MSPRKKLETGDGVAALPHPRSMETRKVSGKKTAINILKNLKMKQQQEATMKNVEKRTWQRKKTAQSDMWLLDTSSTLRLLLNFRP